MECDGTGQGGARIAGSFLACGKMLSESQFTPRQAMKSRQLLVSVLSLVLIHELNAQETAGHDDVQATLKQCQIVRMVLSARERQRAKGDVPGGDDFTAAGQTCDELDSATASSDPERTQAAVAALHAIFARLGVGPTSPQERLAALEKKTAGLSGMDLYYQLPDLAKRAFNAGELEKAESYSTELLQMAAQHPKEPNHGQAIFYGNMVLGRIAARHDDLTQASQYLLASGATTGSPSLDTFGPNMSLAKDLLEKGQRGVVLKYFALCKKFWTMDSGKLNAWSAAVREGQIPDFGANLAY